MIHIGIDPGKKGAVARIWDNQRRGGSLYSWELTPTLVTDKNRPEYDIPAMVEMIQRMADAPCEVMAVVEKQQAMPGQGRSSCFQIGYGYGIWVAILASLKISHAIVHPRTWKKVILRDIPGTDQKARSILAAGKLFPDISLLRTPRCRVKDDNIAEALLLAEYSRRTRG